MVAEWRLNQPYDNEEDLLERPSITSQTNNRISGRLSASSVNDEESEYSREEVFT